MLNTFSSHLVKPKSGSTYFCCFWWYFVELDELAIKKYQCPVSNQFWKALWFRHGHAILVRRISSALKPPKSRRIFFLKFPLHQTQQTTWNRKKFLKYTHYPRMLIVFLKGTRIHTSYPIFGDDDKLVLCHFSKCLYQHRSDEILFKKTQSFGPVRRYFCMTHVQFAYKRHAIVSFHLFKQFNSLSMELINLF